jgi:hypothetical protein
MNTYPKYKIKKGDTIQSITALFGVAEETWLRYHNRSCRLDNVIRKKLPSHLEEIYLPPELWEKADELNSMPSVQELVEKKVNQKIQFGYDNTLTMKFCPDALHYGVMLALFNNDKVNTIKYEIGIRWIAKENLIHIIEINKSNICINDQKPDLVADKLAVQTASAVYPLELIVTRANGIIGINNFEEIQKRWEISKKKIRDYNTGETLDKYLHLTEKTLTNETSLLKSLRNDWFIHSYFNNIYQTYGSQYSFTNIISAPFIFDAKGVDYKIEQKIKERIDERGFIKIEMQGEYCDERSIVDLESGLSFAKYNSAEKITGEYRAQYLLESRYHTIESYMLDSYLELNNSKKISIVVSQIKNKNYE